MHRVSIGRAGYEGQGQTRASRAKRDTLCISGSFRLRENCSLLVRGSAPETFLNAHPCAAARFCETLRRMAVTAGHAPFSFPRCAYPCRASCPPSAYRAAARASRHANTGRRHTLPFSQPAAWRIPPTSS